MMIVCHFPWRIVAFCRAVERKDSSVCDSCYYKRGIVSHFTLSDTPIMTPPPSTPSCAHGAPPKDSVAYQRRLPLMRHIWTHYVYGNPEVDLAMSSLLHSERRQLLDLTLVQMMRAEMLDDFRRNPHIVQFSEDGSTRRMKLLAIEYILATCFGVGLRFNWLDRQNYAHEAKWLHNHVPCDCLVPLLKSNPAYKSAMRLGVCDVCSKVQSLAKLYLCGRCKSSNYCSKECQKADWPEHKECCKDTETTVGPRPHCGC